MTQTRFIQLAFMFQTYASTQRKMLLRDNT